MDRILNAHLKFNHLATNVRLIEKPFNWFAEKINSLVSIWVGDWLLMVLKKVVWQYRSTTATFNVCFILSLSFIYFEFNMQLVSLMSAWGCIFATDDLVNFFRGVISFLFTCFVASGQLMDKRLLIEKKFLNFFYCNCFGSACKILNLDFQIEISIFMLALKSYLALPSGQEKLSCKWAYECLIDV